LLAQVKSTALSLPLHLVAIPFLFFWAGAGFVVGAPGSSSKLHFIGFCLVPPGISEGFIPGVVM
jgi:hypothetical protein